MKKSILLKGLLIATSLPLLAGCVEREVVYGQPAPPPNAVVVEDAPGPPPAQVEIVPLQPDITFVWVPGAWEWRGHWVWIGGRWSPPPHRGAVWIRGGWVVRGGGHVWVRGHWH